MPAAPDVSAERLAAVEQASRESREGLEALQGELESLKKLKVSGYIQGRYSDVENSRKGVDSKGAPTIRDGFNVRRGRLKTSWFGTYGGAVLQIDATPRGVTLKDAEAHLIEPWTKRRLSLVVGQTKWPFGYEVLQSSSDREFPERTRVVRAFAAGERDRGAKLVGAVGVARFQVGAFDGTGTENRVFPGVDNDFHKDVVGRFGVDLKWLSGGVSGWLGRTYDPGTDALYPRRRIGADAQLYFDVLPVGGTAIKAEFIRGESYLASGVEQYGVLAHGYYVLLTQSVGMSNAVAFRYDYFDPFTGVASAADGTDAAKPAATNPVGTVGVTAIHHWNESIKLSATYEIPLTATTGGAEDPKDSAFILQVQARF